MKTHRKHILYITFMLIFVMACRIYSCNGPSTIVTLDKQLISCQGYTDDQFNSGTTCTIPCPDGSKISTDVPSDSIKGQLIGYSLEVLQQQYCPASPLPTEEPTQEPTDVPTDAPTEEATEAPTEPPLQPYLTGAFTACDNTARYVNFTIADPAAPFDPATHKVLFNGVEATCTRAASASNVLTCIYPPAPNGPPATIEVFISGERVNEFNFPGGEICNPVKPPNTEEPEEPQPTEAPTEAPTEPPTEVPTEPTD